MKTGNATPRKPLGLSSNHEMGWDLLVGTSAVLRYFWPIVVHFTECGGIIYMEMVCAENPCGIVPYTRKYYPQGKEPLQIVQ